MITDITGAKLSRRERAALKALYRERLEFENMNLELRQEDLDERAANQGEEIDPYKPLPNGRMRKARPGYYKYEDRGLELLLGNAFGKGAGLRNIVRDVAEFLSAAPMIMAPPTLATSFQTRANRNDPHLHEDRNNIYDYENVSAATFKRLEDESQIMAQRLRDIQAIQDPSLRNVFEAKTLRLANEFEMHLHPITQMYVHDIHRVQRVEAVQKAKNPGINCNVRMIAVWRARAELGDVRGMKAQIGDPNNPDPGEVVVTGEHLSQAVKAGLEPAPTPS